MYTVQSNAIKTKLNINLNNKDSKKIVIFYINFKTYFCNIGQRNKQSIINIS